MSEEGFGAMGNRMFCGAEVVGTVPPGKWKNQKRPLSKEAVRSKLYWELFCVDERQITLGRSCSVGTGRLRV